MTIPWMALLAPMGIGAGIGAISAAASHPERAKAAERERELQAALAQYSPWTKVGPTKTSVPDPSLAGDILGGIQGGAGMGGNIAQNLLGWAALDKMGGVPDTAAGAVPTDLDPGAGIPASQPWYGEFGPQKAPVMGAPPPLPVQQGGSYIPYR